MELKILFKKKKVKRQMEFTKNKYLKEMFEYRKILKTYPEFIPQFSFDNIVEFYESTEFDYFDFQQYSIPFFEDLSTLEYIDLLFSWIDKKLQHDGYTKYRGNLYGKDILEYAINKGGINCLMHGIILQEILIKSGFKAHLVQCNPFDYKIGDCHWLINLFIPEFNKWMMIDPVWLGFCTDTDNIPLDFFEIRKSIIENQKICINKCNCIISLFLTKYIL